MSIELSLDAGSNDSHFTGTYLQGTGLINEKPFWLEQNGSHAIWYHWYTSDWIIGDMTHLGKFQGKIFVNADKNNTYPNAIQPITFKEIGMYNFELNTQIRVSFLK